ncbi:MAG TPA: AAA family ATPase, partial [Gammaproteobacteria bacterium]|nr:AAA family ATPase [Gammaproteobacteria bacterium]
MRDLSIDQAAGLRRMTAPRPVKVIAVTGGKGGVGKTLVAVNLGAALAQLGRSAMLLDADLGLANVDVLLGLHTRLNLEHVLSGECELEDVIVTASSGLRVVPASSGNLAMATLAPAQHAGLI